MILFSRTLQSKTITFVVLLIILHLIDNIENYTSIRLKLSDLPTQK